MKMSRRGLIAGMAVLGLSPVAAKELGPPLDQPGETDRIEIIALGSRDFTGPLLEGAKAYFRTQGRRKVSYHAKESVIDAPDLTLPGQTGDARTVLLLGSDADLLFATEMVRDAGGSILTMANQSGFSSAGVKPGRLQLAGMQLADLAAGMVGARPNNDFPAGPAFMIARLSPYRSATFG
ncbi:hypothetical protein L288_19070 [Sphingobium quisquiliarum P25]|uniref:ABC transporter substrate-binding protein n=1 Tax=Sphingobium quisquiliarum P25 TaxID=1329909 RepID=T0HQI7_9SPHN|nr:hypothetical protein [Sphingobium quisquiliarum]EQA99788.1 hypothetical protein L288_19070 [Sphingobium quisquiliarum P25]